MHQLDSSRRFLYLLARCAAALVTVAGLAIVIGWISNNPFLRGGFSPEGITVKANAGIAFLCCGISLGIQCFSSAGAPLRIARALAVVALVIGALTFSEHLSGLDLGVDQLLFR